jgi:hypothetical protein
MNTYEPNIISCAVNTGETGLPSDGTCRQHFRPRLLVRQRKQVSFRRAARCGSLHLQNLRLAAPQWEPRRDPSCNVQCLGMTRFSQCAVRDDAILGRRSPPLAMPSYGVTVVPMCWLAPPVSGNSCPAMAFGPTNGTASCPRPASCQTVMSMCAIDMNPSPPGPEIVPMR